MALDASLAGRLAASAGAAIFSFRDLAPEPFRIPRYSRDRAPAGAVSRVAAESNPHAVKGKVFFGQALASICLNVNRVTDDTMLPMVTPNMGQWMARHRVRGSWPLLSAASPRNAESLSFLP